MAQGYTPPQGARPKISLTFDADVFDHVNSLAEQEQISFAEAHRRFCKAALHFRKEREKAALSAK